MRIAHLGAFDHDNYGDLLFPHILEWRLAGLQPQIVHAAPTAGASEWQDALPVQAISELADLLPFDAVLIGGGDGIVDGHWWTPRWNDRPLAGPTALPSLWAGGAYVAARHGARLAWNASGVPFVMRGAAAELMRWTTSLSDYIAVRDPGSVAVLDDSGVTEPVVVVPDTAFELSRMWPASSLREDFRNLLAQHGASAEARTILFQFNETLTAEDTAATARAVADICSSAGTAALIVEICPWASTSFAAEVARQVAASGISCLYESRPRSLRTLAACFAHSEQYVGSSFHGLISALSYGRSAVAVVSPQSVVTKKISGTLRLADLPPDHLVDSWTGAVAVARAKRAMPAATWSDALARLLSKLEAHWTRITDLLAEPVRDKGDALARLAQLNPVRPHTTEIYGALLAQRIDALIGDRAHRDAQIRHLETLLAQQVAEGAARERGLRSEIESVRASASWRITAPLRSLHALLAKLRPR